MFKKYSVEKEPYIGIYFISLSWGLTVCLLASSGLLCKVVVCFYCFIVFYGVTLPWCICYSSDGHLGHLHFTAFVNSASVGIVCVFGGQSTILGCVCLEIELLGHWVSVSLTGLTSWNSVLYSYIISRLTTRAPHRQQTLKRLFFNILAILAHACGISLWF